MRILNINSYYYSSTVHKQLQDSMHALGIKFFTYVPLWKNYIPRDECKYGEEEHVIKSECYNKFDRNFFSIKHSKIMKDLEKQSIYNQHFDCIHAHSLFSNGYIAMLVKQKLGIPFIVAVRSTDLNVFFKYMLHLRKLGLKILAEADKIVFLSEPYRDLLISKYVPKDLADDIMNKSVAVPNGIDNFWFENKGRPKNILQGDTLKLVYAGAINKRKNLTATVKAIEILRSEGYKVNYTVAGKVKDQSIFEQIKGLNYVNYLGQVTKEELVKVYRENDIFVMPSITETFGLVYAEAMSQGLPVIYTKGQGFDGQFEEGVIGYHVDPLNPSDIAKRIIDIVNNYERLSSNCIQLFSDKFSWEKITERYVRFYDECISNRA